MPVVKVEMRAGKSKEYKKELLKIIHEALVRDFQIPDADRNHRILEYSPENMEIPANKSADFIGIEITIFRGRTFEAKKNLYKTITEKLTAHLGIAGNDLMIILHEVPLENWGIRGGQPASEVDLGFNVKA